MTPNSRRSEPCSARQRRGTALYVTVLSTALIVSLVGLAGLSVTRIERRTFTSDAEVLEARSLARSAVELGLARLAQESNWSTVFSNDVPSTPRALAPDSTGTVSWALGDRDGSLTNIHTELRLRGIGRVGDTIQVTSVQLDIDNQVGPQILRSMTSSTSQSDDDLKHDKWWCQYVRPVLPSDAISWRVTAVEFYISRVKPSTTPVRVHAFQAAANNRPGQLLAEITVPIDLIDTGWQWHRFNLESNTQLLPSQGICLALTTTSNNTNARISYRSGGMGEPHSALIQGDPNWKQPETDKALRYRLHGVYTRANGTLSPIAGTWRWDPAP